MPLNYKLWGYNHILADRTEPTQGTVQGPAQIQTQTKEPIDGPGSAHSRYQPTTQQIQTQRQPLLWP